MVGLDVSCRVCLTWEIAFMVREDTGDLFLLCQECESAYLDPADYSVSPHRHSSDLHWRWRPATWDDVTAAGFAEGLRELDPPG